MGTKNRQRRTAKQRRQQTGAHRRPGPAGRSFDPVEMVHLAVWAAVDAVRSGDAEADDLVAMLDAGPPVPGGAVLVADAVAAAVRQHVVLAERNGWTEADLAEVERRRLRVPPGASDIARQVHRAAFIGGLPVLPAVVAARSASSESDGALLAKVRALLAKAESTTFEEEADALTSKAHQLMVRHRIDRAAVEAPAHGDGPVGRRIWLDDPYAGAKARLLAEVAAANGCRSVELGGLGCAHVVGFATDLAVVEALHTSLLVQATRAMTAAGRRPDGRGRPRIRSFRQSFLVAFAARIGERLRAAGAEAVADGVAEHGAGVLPVLAGRDDEVDAALAAAFPDLSTRTVSVGNTEGWLAGRGAAELADLGVGDRLPFGDAGT